jgi:uncharacterized membrane protein
MTFFRAFTFEGKRTASKALATVEENGSFVWIDDVAVISVGKLGRAKVESSWAQSDSTVGASAGCGALTGALVGALAGPGGALAGAIGGGAMAGLVGEDVNITVSDPRLDEFADKMKKDTSALILVDDGPYGEEFSTAFDSYGGVFVETELNEKDVKEIRKSLRQVQNV